MRSFVATAIIFGGLVGEDGCAGGGDGDGFAGQIVATRWAASKKTKKEGPVLLEAR